MLKLKEIIKLEKEDLTKYKLHFAIGIDDRREPLYELSRNKFKSWQEYQNKKNFERDFIISLIYYNTNEWIYGGIYKSKSVRKLKDHYEYDTELLDIRKDMIGRLIITFEKKFRLSYVYLEKYFDKLIVTELLRKPYSIDPFTSYENVLIDYNTLKAIIKEEETSWKTALSSIQGIYLITDKKVGKLYVGSAYGEEAFWNRWKNYVENGHGGNKKLREIINENGIEYASNFQFSILEIRSKKSKILDDTEIIERENFWKKVLKSKEFGYNEN